MKRLFRPVTLLAAASGLAAVAHAATYQWDVNGATAGLGGDGTWDTSSLTWDLTGTDADDGTDATVAYTFGSADAAVFTGTAGIVAIDAAGVTINSIRFDSAGYILNGPGTITLAGTTPGFIANANATVNAVIAGAAGLEKTGSAALTLTAANTYTGPTVIKAGALIAAVNTTGSAISGGAVTIESGATLQINNTNTSSTTVTVANTVTGDGLLKLVFSNTSASGTTLSNVTGFTGTIQLSNTGANADKWSPGNIGTLNAALIIDSGSQLYLGSGTATFSKGITVSGTGNSETRGAIRLVGTLGGAITLAADTTIGTEGGSLTGNISTATAGLKTLTFGTTSSTGNATVSGIISDGAGQLAVTKVAAGTLTLSGNNTYTGATSVNAGRLNLTGTNASSITVSSGATLGGAGSTTGSLTLASGAAMILDGGATTGGFTAAGATVSGNLAVTFNTAAVIGTTYTVFNHGGTLTGALTNAAVTGGHGTFTNTGTAATVQYLGANTTSTWNTGTGTWDLYSNNWNTALGDTKYANGDTVVFNNITGTVTTTGTTITPGAVVIRNSGAFTITGGLGGNGAVSKYGAGTFTLGGSSSTGDIAIYGGQLALSSSIPSGARLYVMSGATATNTTTHIFGGVSGTTNLRLLGGTFTGSNREFYVGNIDMAGGTLNGTAAEFRYANSRTVTVLPSTVTSTIDRLLNANIVSISTATFQVSDGPAATDFIFGQNISTAGSATVDGVVKNGLGLMKFTTSTAHGYVGATAVNAGTLELDYATSTLTTGMISASSAIRLGGGNLTLTGKSVASAVTQTLGAATLNAGGSAITLTGATGGVALTTGTLTRNTGATLAIATTGAATLTFGGTAPTLVNGILPYATINGNDFATHAAGAVSAYAGYVNDDYGAAANNVNVTATTPAPATFTVNSLAFRTAQASSLTLAGTNIAGSVLIGSAVGANATTITGGVLSGTAGGELIIHQNNTAGSLTIASEIRNNTSATALVKSGAGTLVLSGANTYTGVTYLNGGVTQFTTQANIGNTTGAITFGGGTLRWAAGSTVNITTGRTVTLGSGGGTFDTNGNNVTLGAFGAGSTGTFTKTGAGTLTMGTANTNFSGDVVVNQGELLVTNGTALGSNANRSIQVNSGATLTLGTNSLSGGHGTAVLRNLYVNGGTVQNISGQTLRLGNLWLNGGTLNTQNGQSADYTTFYLGTQQDGTAGANSTVFVEGTSASQITTTGSSNTGIQLGPNVHFVVADVTGNANADLTVSVTLGNQSLAQSGAAGGLTKLGAGTMSLTAVNTYTGATTVAGGVLNIGGAGSLNSGNYAGAILNDGTLRHSSSADQVLSGIISGTGALTKDTSSTSTLTLSGANTYSGVTTLGAGTLKVSHAAALGTNAALTLNGGNLLLATDTAVNTKNLTLGGNATVTLDRATSGAGFTTTFGGLTSTGASRTLTFAKGANVTDAASLLFNGTLSISGQTTTFDVGDGVSVNIGGSTAGGAQTITMIKTGTGSLILSGGFGTWDAGGATQLNAGTLELRTLMGDNSAYRAALTAADGTTLRLVNDTGTNFMSNTTVNGNMALVADRITTAGANTSHTLGTLTLGASTLTVTRGASITGTAVGGVTFGATTLSDNATVDVGSNAQLTLASVSGSGRNLTVTGAGNTTVPGNIGTTTGTLTKTGAGTLTLSGANTYTGATAVNAGTLLVNGSLAAGGAVTVANAGTILGGTGTVNAAITVNTDAILQGGTGNASGTLTANGALTLASGSIIQLALGSGAAVHSTLARTGSGAWTFDAAQKFTLIDAGAVAGTTYTGLITGLASDPTTTGWSVTNAGWIGAFTYNNGAVDYTLTAIPEPSVYGLLGAGTLMLVAHVRRRRRSAR